MFTQMLGFEWRYFTRQPSFIVTFLWTGLVLEFNYKIDF